VYLNRARTIAPPLGASSPSCAEHPHIRMDSSLGPSAATQPLHRAKRLGAARATRSLGCRSVAPSKVVISSRLWRFGASK
jgi:hypothetical protein